MISRIKALLEGATFTQGQPQEQAQLSEAERNLACAALLIEVAVIDQEFDASEFAALTKILMAEYGIAEEECSALTRLAEQECDEATSMYQFTRKVNDHCSTEEKFNLIKGMWTIAYADGDLDKYEEYIIRKTSDLLYVAHGDFIRAKHAAREERSN